ncbi:MAG: TIGR04211 family SH3 domain-containing protein [Chromatiales bacterium]|jgi:hypothetical protein
MRSAQALIAVVLTLLAGGAVGAHITDRLLAGLYAEPDAGGEPLRLLETGTPVEALGREGGFTRVRLGDDSTGWVQTEYLTDEKPARVRLLELQAQTGETKRRLAAAEQALEEAKAEIERANARAQAAPHGASGEGPGAGQGGSGAPGHASHRPSDPGIWHYLALVAALLIGFAGGFAVYDYRLRRRFGGLRI